MYAVFSDYCPEQYEIKLDIAPMKVYSMAYRCYISLKEFTSGI